MSNSAIRIARKTRVGNRMQRSLRKGSMSSESKITYTPKKTDIIKKLDQESNATS
jgi:hypothetical protein